MQRSLNEIETTLVKAARGLGQAIGVAEDLARAGVWLCRLGCDGVSVVLACLESAEKRELQIETGERVIALPAAHPIHGAQASIDFALGEPNTRVKFPTGLPVPEILIGLAGHASGQFNHSFSIAIGTSQIIEVSKDGASVMPLELPADQVIEIAIAAQVSCDPAISLLFNRPDVDALVWDMAVAMAAMTYVPATEESRASGAGAGLTDND